MRPAKADATWPTCQQPDCVGLTYAESDICVTHGTAENRVAALAELTRGEDCTWTRGLDIDEKLLTDIRNAVSQDNEGWPQFPSMDFAWATFHTDAQFSFSRFLRSAVFDGCAFLRRAEFGATHFTHGCSFGKAEFNGRAFFKQAKIQEQGRFEKAVFHDLAGFNIAAAGNMSFDGSDFEDMAVFSGSWSQASFRECQFKGAVQFNSLITQGCNLTRASFEEVGDLGSLFVKHGIVMKDAKFRESFVIRVSAAALRADIRTYSAGRLEFLGDLDLGEADLGGSMLLSAIPESVLAGVPDGTPINKRARLLSLKLTDVRLLTIGAVDLSACLMSGAHGLDSMKVEPTALWGTTPRTRRLARRTIIADEILQRADDTESGGWAELASNICAIHEAARMATGSEGVRPEPSKPTATDVAGTYRSLRKGREDGKDLPGAADFYFGEMEMRRKASRWWSVDGMTLRVYWLASGYALRAARAFVALALLILLASVGFTTFGFDRSPSEALLARVDLMTGEVSYRTQTPSYTLWDGLAYSIQSATSLLRIPQGPALTPFGQAIETLLRFGGPVLLALGVLALRGRVKR